jgi:hypothetical protein
MPTRVVTWRNGGIALAVVAVGVAVALVLGVGGLWAHRSSTRAAVDLYIKRVDAAQQQMRLPLTNVMTAFHGYSTLTTTPRGRNRLRQATRTFGTLERRVAAIPAPPAATRLHRLLVQLVERERLVAAEAGRLAIFTPGFVAVRHEMSTAQTRLGHALAQVKGPRPHVVRGTPAALARARAAFKAASAQAAAEQADAVRAYDRALARATTKLRALRPPPVMAPAYRTQLRTVLATRAAGAMLVVGLLSTNRAQVPVLSRRLAAAARIAGAAGAQRAEADAIKAYDARVRAIAALQRTIQVELSRLSRVVT